MNKAIAKNLYILILTFGLPAFFQALNLESLALGALVLKRNHCVLFDVSDWKNGDRALLESSENKNAWVVGKVISTGRFANTTSPERPFICCKIEFGPNLSVRIPQCSLGKYLPPDYLPNHP